VLPRLWRPTTPGGVDRVQMPHHRRGFLKVHGDGVVDVIVITGAARQCATVRFVARWRETLRGAARVRRLW
jgi:hypothetical protein